MEDERRGGDIIGQSEPYLLALIIAVLRQPQPPVRKPVKRDAVG
jgi:hypothetical protein